MSPETLLRKGGEVRMFGDIVETNPRRWTSLMIPGPHHRNMWTALGVVLVSIGLGGLVALRVGATLVSHPVHLVSTEKFCAAVTGIGGAILVALLPVFLRLRRVKRKIAEITAEGTILLRDAKLIPDDDELGVDELADRFNSWRIDAAEWLRKHDYPSAIHFENEAGLVTVQELHGTRGASWCQCEIDVRLGRLAELSSGR
ncbi:MAG: hypothetical protein P4L20_11575 [Acidimicrobiales bacterium]|nr:hypothetical protein [Acidimicrobiales bacterium]